MSGMKNTPKNSLNYLKSTIDPNEDAEAEEEDENDAPELDYSLPKPSICHCRCQQVPRRIGTKQSVRILLSMASQNSILLESSGGTVTVEDLVVAAWKVRKMVTAAVAFGGVR
ncbi:hypothetical protein PIB30_048948 [Stylosanthes scabra]|uniref:Uncharacterized protein n=1 Tax=Stylosanthes scabra TaxID=79078 RepID=A0ABU6QHP1_9FABA|nr:hypothetical protein [Stylosanthes scabra]